MWMLTRYGNYSAVWKGGSMQVRARVRADLKRLIDRGFVPADTKIIETADGRSDYRYRILVTREVWAEAARQLSMDIDYGNFKSEVMKSLGAKRESPLHQIWSILAKLQPGGAYARAGNQQLKSSQVSKEPFGTSNWHGTVYAGARADEVWIDELVPDDDDEYVQQRLAEAFVERGTHPLASTTEPKAPKKRKRGKRSGR